MRFPWVKIEYVPIVSIDPRTYEDKWKDGSYLKQVQAMGNNQVYLTEINHALEVLRGHADAAKTPEQLAGINVGIAVLNRLLIAPKLIKNLLEVLEIG